MKSSEFLESSEFVEPESSQSSAARGQEVVQKLLRSVGKAAWIAGTTFIVLGIPLLFALEKEAAYIQMENLEYDRQAEMEALLGPTSSSHQH
ncbi:hypothetical protein HU200_016593 [Digitaria exilis]|uniref:Uncharacterized protein n=1 Tax=Digitaria exilis TaxID=1010633 RepID=A0A835F7I0_9POAL|nr:hypothetical protein HU200_016593 [Digitaria exilis]CAB3491329.1 unnamed protein product [Digitaria exilis]